MSGYEEKSELGDIIDEIKGAIGKWKKPLLIGGAIVALAGLGFASIKPVASYEVGVVTTLGQYTPDPRPPGFNVIIPIVQGMEKVDVTKIYTINLGYEGEGDNEKNALNDDEMRAEAQKLTGDLNIIWSSLTIQYRIDDPVAYVFNVEDPKNTLTEVVSAVSRQVTGDYGVDEQLTFGRAEIEHEMKQDMQDLLDEYNSGIKIVAVQLQKTQPPNLKGSQGATTVADAFNDVINAGQQRQEKIENARGYENRVVPGSEGTAAEMKAEAEGAKAERVSLAELDVAEFTKLLQQYRMDPEGTMNRLRLETWEKIYKNVNITVVDKDLEGLLQHLNLNEEVK